MVFVALYLLGGIVFTTWMLGNLGNKRGARLSVRHYYNTVFEFCSSWDTAILFGIAVVVWLPVLVISCVRSILRI